MGQEADLVHPVTFNEKLQWLKLHDRRPLYTAMVDKVAVKDYAAQIIGKEHIIPTLGVWEHPDEIDFDALPAAFVLKCNHNSGRGMVICRDKTRLNREQMRQGLAEGLREDYYLTHREWPYKEVPRRILAEPLLPCGEQGLTDYKLYCFGGVPRCILVCQDRFSVKGVSEDFFTPDWERLPVRRPQCRCAAWPIARPERLEEMLQLAAALSADIPFVRVDLYAVGQQVYFSELTFYPAAGFERYEPEEWDAIFGSWLELPFENLREV